MNGSNGDKGGEGSRGKGKDRYARTGERREVATVDSDEFSPPRQSIIIFFLSVNDRKGCQ